MNIIFVISDTLRRDRLGCYGNKWVHAPNLDMFVLEAVVFDRGLPSGFPTMPVRADLMTGRYSFTGLGWVALPREATVLSQLLSNRGYRTMAIVDTPFFARDGAGYDRGFDDLSRRVVEFLPATITSGNWALLYTCEGAHVELYNLRDDPGQRRNVARQNMQIVQRLHHSYHKFLVEAGTDERLLAPRAKL